MNEDATSSIPEPGFFSRNMGGLIGAVVLGLVGLFGGPIGGVLMALVGLVGGSLLADRENGFISRMLQSSRTPDTPSGDTTAHEQGQAAGQQHSAAPQTPGMTSPNHSVIGSFLEEHGIRVDGDQVKTSALVGVAATSRPGRAVLSQARNGLGTVGRVTGITKALEVGGRTVRPLAAIRGGALLVETPQITKWTQIRGGGVNFAGQMGLFNAAMTAGGDAISYATGAKELTYDNATATTLNTIVDFDPIKGVTSAVDGLTNLVGIDTNIDKISIDRGVTALLGGTAWAPGIKPGESVSGIINETMGIYAELDRPKEGGLRYGINPEHRDKPSVSDYRYLGGLRGQLARFIPGEEIDGHNVRSEFNEIDFTKPENHRAYRLALSKYILEQENIKIENMSWIPRWLRSGESAQKYEMANLTLNELYAAEKEYAMFTGDVRDYSEAVAQAQARDAVQNAPALPPTPTHSVTVDASGVRAPQTPAFTANTTTNRNGPTIGADGLPVNPGGGASIGS